MLHAARETRLVSAIDVVPTILDLLGEPASAFGDLKGQSLQAREPRPAVFAEMSRPDLSTFREQFPAADTRPYDRALQAIRTAEHKLILASDGAHALYDLRADPQENHNLIETQPALHAALAAQLEAWRASLTPARHTHAAPEFSPEVVTRLRALGYLE
jgi:arylsulfatase A-like enzyme